MKAEQTDVNICMITDDNYIMPTAVAIHSMIVNKGSEKYNFYIITSNLSDNSENEFKKFERDDVSVTIIREDADKRFSGLHKFTKDSICVASISALLKFLIPDLLSSLDKVLYLDGDLIVQKDLYELYSIDLEDNYVAAVPDSSNLYWKNNFNTIVRNYFNSGVMVLNLKKMRENNIRDVLIETKRNLTDTSLMDQNVFNIVFDGSVKTLPIKYNILPLSLDRAFAKWNINDVNLKYNTNYISKGELFTSAVIIHYSSKEKPWKEPNYALSYIWNHYYLSLYGSKKESRKEKYGISVIIPCYNVENYIDETLASILNQSFKDYEIILIDDGSTDSTKEIIDRYAERYDNISAYHQTNHGQGFERNFGIKMAKGRYIHFMDSDDLLEPDCYEKTYFYAYENDIDCVLFEGKSFYENDHLEAEFPQYKTCYSRKEVFPKIYNGKDLFTLFRSTSVGLIIQPGMQLIKRDFLVDNDIYFPELKMMEDNLFVYKAITRTNRIIVLPNAFYNRRIRESSTMTTAKDEIAVKAFAYTIQEVLKDYDPATTEFDFNSAVFKQIIQLCKTLKIYYDKIENNHDKEKFLEELGEEKSAINLCLFFANASNENAMQKYTTAENRALKDRIIRTNNDKKELVLKLQQTYKEKSEISAKLQRTYKEKSEINAKLQRTYKEKSEKTKQIKMLKKWSLYPIIRRIKKIFKKH